MKEETLYDNYMKDKYFKRLMAQEDLIMDVTEGFCEILKEEKISRTKLAQIMGKTKGYISQLLNGGRNISLRTLSDISYYLGYNVYIMFRKKISLRKQNRIAFKWDLESDQCSFRNIHVADDYLYINDKVSRLGS